MNALAKLVGMVLLAVIILQMLVTYLFSRPNNPLTYYDVLGVDVQASNADIKQHYRKLVRELHPDHQSSRKKKKDPSPSEFSLDMINQSYNTLSHPNKRVRYDFTLGNPSVFHYDIVRQCQQDKIKRIFEYDRSWDDEKMPVFQNINTVLTSYSQEYPQYSHLARQIYGKGARDDDEATEIHPKPYILVKVVSYDNTISYHFSDWKDQLNKPRETIISMIIISVSLIAAVGPLWFVCVGSPEGPDPELEAELKKNNKKRVNNIDEETAAEWGDISYEEVAHIKTLSSQAQQEHKEKQRQKEKLQEQSRMHNIKNKQIQELIRKEVLAKRAAKRQYHDNEELSPPAEQKGMVIDMVKKEDPPVVKVIPHSGPLSCQLCQKTYKSENQYNGHMMSKQHRVAVKEAESAKKQTE